MTDTDTDTDIHEFSFEEGDQVRVRVREHGTRGKIIAKFTGECVLLDPVERASGVSPLATIQMPWGLTATATFRPTDAEFELVEDGNGAGGDSADA